MTSKTNTPRTAGPVRIRDNTTVEKRVDFRDSEFDADFEEDTPVSSRRTGDKEVDGADPIVPYSNVVKRPGHTVTEAEITLHTRLAHRLFYGRRRAENVEPIIGLVRFVSNTNAMCETSRQDDPYADAQLLKIEAAMDKLDHSMKEELEDIQTLLHPSEERRVVVKSLGSVAPATFRLSFQHTYGFRAADLLGLYDELVNSALAAQHVGRFFQDDWNRVIGTTSRHMRHAFFLSGGYRFSGAKRDDFAANNANARRALDKFGELPAEVLSGKRRPLWAPRST
ncbi:MAG: TIGR03761 family integrating conjugative element protein [Gammaproteobacteria bacterium]